MATRLSQVAGVGMAPARVPPHNLEAEESVLGACLLSRQAIATAIEVLTAEDFYKPAHTEMFRIMLELYARGEPLDAVTLGEELRRRGNLDEFGGKPYLFTLVSSVPTPGSVGHYARIVQENATLRRLIEASQQITDLAFALPEDVEEAVDQSEDLIYQVANRRVSEDLAALKDLLTENMELVEKLYERGSAITGVATGFSDLDELTAGLQPSNLIIVAARPSMGKALALPTPIATPSGWTTMGEIGVGDCVFDERGQRCRVEHVSPVYTDHDCYEVEFDDGSVIVADAGHQWLVSSPRAFRARVVTTAEMMAAGVTIRVAGLTQRRWYLQVAESLNLAATALPIDPYVLGCCLAYGDPATPHTLHTADRSHLADEFAMAGSPIGLLLEPREELHPAYLRASFKQRLALLQGFMDVAGTVERAGTSVELCLGNARLLAQVRELACSLGHKPGPVGHRPAAPGRGAAGVLAWSPPDQVFRLPRKADRMAIIPEGAAAVTPRHCVVGIRPIAPVPVRCIQVGSPSHLYLAGASMVPTHNSALALSIAQHVAANDHVPVVIFSLEMSKMELVQRLMCSEARVDSNRLRKGALQDSDWPKLSLALGRLAEAPIFIDDTPNATIMEMRAKCRRVASKSGLGLVIIDYLQLMAPLKRTDNRVQEVSEISRSLKILARELDVPVIALSQLSRNVEYRADKRPLLADLRESGCVTADTRILRADTGAGVTMGELLASGETPRVWSLDADLHLVARRLEKVFPSGVKEVFEVCLASGRSVKASANHPFLTPDGWMPLRELPGGTRVATPGQVPEPLAPRPVPEAEIVLSAQRIGDGSHGTFLPAWVFSLPKDQLALFLRHLWAGGGCVRWDETVAGGRVSYRCATRRLAGDVSGLLLRFGILTRLHPTGRAGSRHHWQLDITGAEGQLRFIDQIGGHGGGGASARNAGDHLRAVEARRSREAVPDDAWQRVKERSEPDAFGDRALAGTRGAPSRLLSEDPTRGLPDAGEISWDEITQVRSLGEQPVYDATISDTHNFIAEGINLHNSIEQDADLVMFIYRDEVYHPDSPQRGIAELHISKHRSGPIGKVELTFLEHYTKFANLARGM